MFRCKLRWKTFIYTHVKKYWLNKIHYLASFYSLVCLMYKSVYSSRTNPLHLLCTTPLEEQLHVWKYLRRSWTITSGIFIHLLHPTLFFQIFKYDKDTLLTNVILPAKHACRKHDVDFSISSWLKEAIEVVILHHTRTVTSHEDHGVFNREQLIFSGTTGKLYMIVKRIRPLQHPYSRCRDFSILNGVLRDIDTSPRVWSSCHGPLNCC